MIREEYLRRLVDNAYVDLYLSSVDGCRIYWPWRMLPPSESSMRYRNACEQYLIDSQPQSPAVGNADVLDEAVRVNADAVLLADYFPFEMYYQRGGPLFDHAGDLKGGREEDLRALEQAEREYGDAHTATVHRVRDGYELAQTHPFDGEIILPLQAPFSDAVGELPSHDRYAVGGLKDASASDTRRVEAARETRAAAPDAWIHGLGWGATDSVVAAVHDDPTLLDSVDYSTPIQNAIHGVARGEERTSVTAAHAGATLIEDLRLFSSYIDTPPSSPETEATAMSDFT